MTATPDTSRRASPLENDPRSDELSANATVPEAACTDPADLARLVIEGLFGLILSDPPYLKTVSAKAWQVNNMLMTIRIDNKVVIFLHIDSPFLNIFKTSIYMFFIQFLRKETDAKRHYQ